MSLIIVEGNGQEILDFLLTMKGVAHIFREKEVLKDEPEMRNRFYTQAILESRMQLSLFFCDSAEKIDRRIRNEAAAVYHCDRKVIEPHKERMGDDMKPGDSYHD